MKKEIIEPVEVLAQRYAHVQYGDPAKFAGLRECEPYDNGIEDFTAGYMSAIQNSIRPIVSEAEERVVKCIADDIRSGYTPESILYKIKTGSYIGSSLETFQSYAALKPPIS